MSIAKRPAKPVGHSGRGCAAHIGNVPVPTVLAASAHGVLERIAAAGVDPEDVLCEVDLNPEDIAEPTNRIRLSDYCNLFEIAAQKTGRNNFGLEFGGSYHPQNLGLLGYLAISSDTLGAALHKFSVYHAAHQQGTHVSVSRVADGTAVIDYAILDRRIANRQQDAELSVAMLINVVRHGLGPRWSPRAVHLMHSRPRGRVRYEEVFGTSPQFEQSSNRIILRGPELESTMPRRDANLARLTEIELGKRLSATDCRVDVIDRARYEIAIALQAGACNLAKISRQCGLEPWTLKRRLKQAGLTFHQLMSDMRHELAVQYLARHVPVTEVAHALGYSQLSAFSRAFRERTGRSPKKFEDDRTRASVKGVSP